MLDQAIIFFADYYIFIVGMVIVIEYVENRREKLVLRNHFEALCIALITRFGVATIIRDFYHRLRPFVALNFHSLVYVNSYSFPSRHTIFLFALATSIYFFNKKLAYFVYISGIIVGVARVMAGVHYPSDILAGIILGMLSAYVFWHITSYVRKKYV